jgi:hypothetical protein
MWRILALVALLPACHRAAPTGELSHEECADLVRHVQRLQSADTGGLRDALNVGLRAGIEGCLARGTVRAYQCSLQAQTVGELESCDIYFKE